MVCECLLWLSGGWLITCFSLDVFFFCLLLYVSLFSLQMTALPKSAWMARRESSCWWQEQTLYQSTLEVLLPELSFSRGKGCPVQAGRKQTGSVHRGWWWRGMPVNGQCLQWVRELLTQHPSLDKMWRQESTRWKDTRVGAWRSIFRRAEKKEWTGWCSIIFYTKKRKQIVVLHWRLIYVCICVGIYLYIHMHI